MVNPYKAAHGHPPASVGRICKALGRAGAPHCEDYTSPRGQAARGNDPFTERAHPCRQSCNLGSHRGHRRDDTCREGSGGSAPDNRPVAPTRPNLSLGKRRALLPAEAGPDYRPCAHQRAADGVATAEAREAMQALANTPATYPGQAPPAAVTPTPHTHSATGSETGVSHVARTPPHTPATREKQTERRILVPGCDGVGGSAGEPCLCVCLCVVCLFWVGRGLLALPSTK